MPRTKLDRLLEEVKTDHPSIDFISSTSTFSWKSSTSSILYNPNETNAPQLLLHELGHAIRKHRNYNSDIQLLRMEREAWLEAQSIAPTYGYSIDEDFVEESLDSYRDWIHRKSTCPNCGSNGFQDGDYSYRCPLWQNAWKVNNGIVCRIYRTKLK